MEKNKNKRKSEKENESNSKKTRIFSGQEFRKELKEGNLLICLKNFLKIAKEEENCILQYLEAGGSVQEILLSLDETAKTDLLSALPVFRVLHLIFFSVKDNDNTYYAQAQDGVKFLMNSFIPTIQAMININSNKHRKAVLKVLTDIVTLFPSYRREIIGLIPNTPTIIHQLLQPQTGADSVRKWFIFFILSFIVVGDISLIRTIMSMKGLLGEIMIDMKYDEASTITVFLSVVREKVLENLKVTKSLKLKVFNTQVVSALFELYNWKGPKNINVQKKEKEVNSSDAEFVSESVHSFLLVLCTSKRFGIIFSDNVFRVGDVKNNLLLTVIQSLSDPWENKRMSDIIIQIIVACPDLLNVVLSKMESAAQPKESKKWDILMKFVESLLLSLNVKNILKTALEISDVDIVRLAKMFCIPNILIRSACEGIKNINNLPILYYSIRILTLMWRNVEDVLLLLSGSKHKLENPLISAFHKCFLDIDDILKVWEHVCSVKSSLKPVVKEKFLNVILEFLEMKCKCELDNMDSPSRIAWNILDALDAAKESLPAINYINIRSRVFYLITSVDPMFVTPDNDLFRTAVCFLFTNKSKSTIETLAKIILSTGVFENNESEIDIWLACYFDGFQEFQHFVPRLFSDCISRLYLKEVDLGEKVINSPIKDKSLSAESLEADGLEDDLFRVLKESPTPMLIQFLELLTELRSEESKKQTKEGRNYINAVALRLFHYYYNSQTILNICREYKNQMNNSVLTYMEGAQEPEFHVKLMPLLMPIENELLSWIFENKNDDLKNVLKPQDDSKLSLYLTFNTLISYLVSKVRNDVLSDNDVSKLSECICFIVKLRCSEDIYDGDTPNILCYSVESLTLLRRKCIQCLFSLPLTEKFDICECNNKSVVNFTRIITTVIPEMNRDLCRNYTELRPWKTQLLSKIKDLGHNNSAEVFGYLQPVLEWFYYTSREISGILNGYCAISNISMFVNEGRITASTLILTKFAKMQCEYSEVRKKVIEHLWIIMKHVKDKGSSDLDVLDECFIYILRKRPQCLFLIDDGFLGDLILRPGFQENTVQLAKLLMNDPNKIKYFLTFAKNNFKNLNKKIIVSLLTAMILEEDKFLQLLRSREYCCYWKEKELFEEESDMSELLKLVYERYKDHLVWDKRKDSDFIRKHSTLFSILMKRYVDKDVLLGMDKIIISEELFIPEVIHDSIMKYQNEKHLVELYATGILNILYRKMQEAENGECNELIWANYNKFVRDLTAINMRTELSVLVESPTWRDFVRRTLRICFNFPDCPSMLATVRSFVELLYEPGKNSKHTSMMFEMLVSHSQFLGLMLHRSQLKTELVKFYYQLIRLNNRVLSVKHIPLILASYSASLSENDVTLMKILKFYEDHNISLDDYQPLVWGEPAVNHYSVKSNVGVSLWRSVNMLNVLEMLDPKRMEESLREFPLNRTGNFEEEVVTYNERVYDPAFLLPVFSNLLSPGAVTYCMPFIQKGCFAYTLRSLSSTCKHIRVSAAVVLSRLYNHLELVQNMKLKSVWLHFINCLRYAVEHINAEPVPSVMTFFLGKTSLELSGEPGEMFTSLQRFLLAKPVFNFNYVPEFLPLFHSSDVNFQKHRRWLLEVLKDGIKEKIDLDILFQTMVIKIIFSYFKSHLCAREFKMLTLEVLTNMMKTSNAKLLISEYGLLTWLNAISLSCDKELFSPFVKLISKVSHVIRMDLIKNAPGKLNLFYPVQVLNSLMRALPNLKVCRSTETVESFLNVVLQCLTTMLIFKQKTWCKMNSKKLDELKEITAGMVEDVTVVSKFEKSKIFFVFYDYSSNIEKLYQRIVFLWGVLLGIK